MTNSSALKNSADSAQKCLRSVIQFMSKSASMLVYYKTEISAFSAFSIDLMALQGVLQAGTEPDASKLTGIASTLNQTILPQIASMVSANTQMIAMSSLAMAKAINGPDAKALNAELSALNDTLLRFGIALQAAISGGGNGMLLEIQNALAKGMGAVTQTPPPTAQQLSAELSAIAQDIAQHPTLVTDDNTPK